MTNMTSIIIDGERYHVEPGNYTLAELLAHTDLDPEIKSLNLVTRITGGKTFQITGGEDFELVDPKDDPPARGTDTTLPANANTRNSRPGSGVSVLTTKFSNGRVGAPYSASIAAGGGRQPLEFSLNGQLPDGLGLNTSNGVISGTPETAGTFSFSVSFKDGDGVTSQPQSLSITII